MLLITGPPLQPLGLLLTRNFSFSVKGPEPAGWPALTFLHKKKKHSLNFSVFLNGHTVDGVKLSLFVLCVIMYMCGGGADASKGQKRIGPLGAVVTGHCELSDVRAGNQMWC